MRNKTHEVDAANSVDILVRIIPSYPYNEGSVETLHSEAGMPKIKSRLQS